MQFKPKTKDDIQKEERDRAEKFLLPRGDYDFEVVSAEDTVSKKSGAQMIKLKLNVYGKDGNEHFLFDYLVPSMEHKLYHFAHATGIGHLYDAGGFEADDCTGRAGVVKIKIEKSEEFGPKNSVQDYVVQEKTAQPGPSAAPADKDPADDDIPF